MLKGEYPPPNFFNFNPVIGDLSLTNLALGQKEEENIFQSWEALTRKLGHQKMSESLRSDFIQEKTTWRRMDLVP